MTAAEQLLAMIPDWVLVAQALALVVAFAAGTLTVKAIA